MLHNVQRPIPANVRPHRRLPYILGLVILLGLTLLGILYLANRMPFLRHTPAAYQTNNSYTKGEHPSSGEHPSNSSSSSNQDSKSSSSVGEALLIPTGNFVSNHHPSLSNHPNGAGYLTSTCSTTPGASCQITFTKGDTTKSLATETTDAGGTAYWNNWQPSDLGLTQGSWSITAVATLGSRTLTTRDALPLEVGP